MFILLRRVERWLHQHVFKVGWLSTHNYQTTTILYYTFFLPGIILHEVIYYLAAGIVNVRAERQIKWPDEQDVGELKLNFIKLAPRTSAFRKAVVTSAPLLAGLICVWSISNYIFDITTVVARMSSGELSDVGAALNLLINAPLFWLWIYIIFTIANTMFPTVPKDLRGWRSVLIGLAVVALALFLVGIGGELFEVLQSPLSTIILVLTQTFVLLIAIDIVMVLVLGLIEYTIERVTGHSATFRGNRMVTMTREEAIEEREKDRERDRKKTEREQRRRATATAGPISIYSLAFAIPGAPGEEPITQLESLSATEEDIQETAQEEQQVAAMPLFGGLSEGTQEPKKELSEQEKQEREAIASRINLPSRRPPMPETLEPSRVSDDDAAEKNDKPAASLTSRFGKPKTEDSDHKDKSAAPLTSRFGKPKTEDSDEKDKSAASLTSCFGTPSRFGQATTTDGKDDAEKDKPAASISPRFGKSVSTDEKDTPASVASSRFGVKPISKTDDTTEKDEKPAASLTSRFGKPKTEDSDEKDKPAASLTSRFGKPRLEDSDDKDESTTSSTSRFGAQSRFGKPVSTDEKDDAEKDKPAASISSRFDKPKTEDSDKDKDEKPAASINSRFGQSSSLGQFGRKTDDKASEDDKVDAPDDDETIRVVGRPASPSLLDDEDDDDEAVDESLLRRGRDDGAISSLFGQLNQNDDSADDEDDDESIGGLGRLRSTSSLSSRFGSSRPSPKPMSPLDDKDDDDSEDDKSISSLSSYRRSSPLTTRFGSSRPAPKPSASTEETDDSNDESIVYEDIDDEYLYEDEDDYVEYDDDEEFYEDEDD